MSAIQQDITVKIRTVLEGLDKVKEYGATVKKAVTDASGLGAKKLALNSDTSGGSKFLTVVRQLSPALDSSITKAEQLTGTLGTGGLTGVLGPVAIGVTAIGAALTALGAIAVAAIQKGVELGSKYHDLSAQSGLTIETLSGLDSQLRQSGTSTETLARGTLQLQKGLGEAARSGKAFGLGITDNNAALSDIDGTLRTVLTRLGAMDKGARNVEGLRVFGKAWRELSVFVEDTGGDIDETLRKAREAGEIMSSEVAGNLDDLGDAWDRLEHHAAVAGGNIAGIVAPEITKALEEIDSALGSSLAKWETWALGIAIGVARVRGVIEGFVKWAHRPLREMSPQNMGKDIQEGADAAEIDAVITYVTNKLNPKTPKPKGNSELSGGGGKGGGKSLAEKLREAMADVRKSEDAITAAGRDANTADLSDQLAREKQLITRALEDRLISYADYYKTLERIETESIDNEITRQLEALAKIDEELKRKRSEITGDKDLKPGERVLKETAAAADADAKATPILQKITELERDRAGVTSRIASDARKTLEAYQGQLAALQNELLRANGEGVEAAKHEVDTALKEMRERAIAEGDKTALAIINAVRSKRVREAQSDDQLKRLQEKLQELRDAKDAIDAEAAIGAISQEEAERRKLDIARLMRGELESIYGELKAIADKTTDKELQAAVARLGVEIAQVGVQVDTLAQDINRDLKQALEDTLFAIIRRQQSLKDAVTSLVNHILDELARLASSAIIEKLFGENGIFGGVFNSKGGQGGIGGILSDIFRPRTSGSNPQTPQGRVGVLDNSGLIIKNFQSVTSGHLTGIKGNTFSTVSELRGGFGGIGAQLNELISFLPNLLPAEQPWWKTALLAAIQVAGTIANAKAAKKFGPKQYAVGDMIRAVAGGRLIQVAEGGYDELVVTTDPKHKGRTANLLAEFMRRTGILPNFGAGVDFGQIVRNIGLPVPAFEAGGFALDSALHSMSELPPRSTLGDGAPIQQHFHNTYQVQDGRLSRLTEAILERNIARAARKGMQRSIASRKGG